MNRTALLILTLCACLGAAYAADPQPLERVQVISLSGIEGRLDHMCVDVKAGLLYLAALTNNSLEVIDLKEGKRARSLPGPRGPQGVMLLPDSHEIAVTSGADGVFRIFDEKLNLVRFLGGLKNADNLRYDSASGHVFLSYAKALAVIDPQGPTKLTSIPLGGHAESFQMEKDGNNIYVNVPDAREVVVINKDNLQTTAHWQMLEARDNYPMALDEKGHRLFVGCRSRAKVLIYDTQGGSYIGKVDCVNDADDIHYDSERRRIYVTGGQGYLTVIKEVDPYLYKAEANITTSVDARTSCFEPSTGTLYLAVPRRREQSAAIWVYKTHP